MILSLVKVSGHSMEPKLKSGSFFIVSSIPYFFKNPVGGDIILFKYNNKNIIKKIIKFENKKYFIEGENLKDSMKFEPIIRKDILGKLVYKF